MHINCLAKVRGYTTYNHHDPCMCKSSKVLLLRMEVTGINSQANQAEKASRGKSLDIPERKQKK